MCRVRCVNVLLKYHNDFTYMRRKQQRLLQKQVTDFDFPIDNSSVAIRRSTVLTEPGND